MRKLHWSQTYINFITIEVTYSDNARQGWDYDCSQFNTLEDLKLNMAADFLEPRPDWSTLMVYVTRNGESHSAEIDVTNKTGGEFVVYIFDSIESMLNGN